MCTFSFPITFFFAFIKLSCSADFVSGGEFVFILLVAVIGLSRQSHDFDENKQLDHESTVNFPLIHRLFP